MARPWRGVIHQSRSTFFGNFRARGPSAWYLITAFSSHARLIYGVTSLLPLSQYAWRSGHKRRGRSEHWSQFFGRGAVSACAVDGNAVVGLCLALLDKGAEECRMTRGAHVLSREKCISARFLLVSGSHRRTEKFAFSIFRFVWKIFEKYVLVKYCLIKYLC